MNWIDYRIRLGLGFSDSIKEVHFRTKCINYFRTLFLTLDLEMSKYISFCNITGTPINKLYLSDAFSEERLEECLYTIECHSTRLVDFLSYVIAFVQSICASISSQKKITCKLCEILKEVGIQYDLYEDEDGYFIFPKGVPEFDDALVSEVYEWLHKSYKKSETAWRKALKAYSDATDEKASEIADSFRKALETFFQEFFDSNKTLENLKPKYGDYLKNHNVPTEISNNLETLLQQYTNFMNNYAKHRDRTSDSLLEYIMYQTGNTMRLLITLKDTDG